VEGAGNHSRGPKLWLTVGEPAWKTLDHETLGALYGEGTGTVLGVLRSGGGP
jgi:hypothetical protein